MNWIVINIGFLLANLMILALNIKLYTEMLKDKSMDRRATASAPKEMI